MRLPANTYKVPDNPLYVMTALYLEDEGGARVLGVKNRTTPNSS